MPDDVERALTLVGIVAVAVGLGAVLRPGTVGHLVRDDLLIRLVGLAALVQAGRSAYRTGLAGPDAAALPDVHRFDPATVQGETFDDFLARSVRRGHVGERHRRRLREHVRESLVRTLLVADTTTEEAVRASIADGSWTDDPVAAALFTVEYEPSRGDRVRARLGLETTFQRRVRHAVEALERQSGRSR